MDSLFFLSRWVLCKVRVSCAMAQLTLFNVAQLTPPHTMSTYYSFMQIIIRYLEMRKILKYRPNILLLDIGVWLY